MPNFGPKSWSNLETCHSDLILIAKLAIEHFNFSVIWGFRNEEQQNQAFHEGYSKKKWPLSKHNKVPSLAMDLAPYPIDWDDRDRFIYLAGFIMNIAMRNNIDLLWGGDWNMNFVIKDERFQDLGHFEIRMIGVE